MFNKSNFCHIASNNRNEQKGSVFIYKTTDTLAQVTQSGYFNEKLIDINVHDLIIHVQYNPVDRTLKKSVLIVTERTLDNVETAPILDQTIGDDIADLGDQVQGIEEKIPGAASAANQLADKAFVNDIKTAIETTIAGINTSISTLNDDLSQTNQNLSQTDQNVDSLQETKQDKATAVNYNNITNCITEIPQDIQLELNNGAITLKANSKLYQPNGSGVFTPIVMSADKARSDFSAFGSGTYLLFYSQSYGGLVARNINNCVSGATDTSTATSHTWYDTTNNKIKTYENGSYTLDDLTLPLCAFENTYGTGATSIKHVFNGFGYIGSTMFALPGVKGLVPNGRNADGTLKNNERTVSSVLTYTSTYWYNDVELYIGDNSILVSRSVTYDEPNNILSATNVFYAGKANLTSDFAVKSLTPKTPFRAVDYNDLESTTDALKNAITIAAPAGMVSSFAGKTAPSGWLKCDGSAVSRTTYASLFAAVGTTYGAGDGSTTFNLPNLIGYLPLGMDSSYVGRVTNGVLPNILGEFYTRSAANPSGAFYYEESTASNPAGTGAASTGVARVAFNASRYNSMYGGGWYEGTRVIPASVGMTYCIKY